MYITKSTHLLHSSSQLSSYKCNLLYKFTRLFKQVGKQCQLLVTTNTQHEVFYCSFSCWNSVCSATLLISGLKAINIKQIRPLRTTNKKQKLKMLKMIIPNVQWLTILLKRSTSQRPNIFLKLFIKSYLIPLMLNLVGLKHIKNLQMIIHLFIYSCADVSSFHNRCPFRDSQEDKYYYF